MTYQQIKSKQKELGYWEMQQWIDSGAAWHLEGSIGRAASELLEIGACMLPKEPKSNAYGGVVPSRDWLKKGTKGTFQNSVKFYSNVENYENV